MVDYPDVVDFESVSLAIDIVKNREINERRKEFCKAGWNIAGYLLKISVGEPEAKFGAMYAHSGKLQDALEDLEQELTSYEQGPMQFSAKGPEEPKDIGTVLLIVSTIISLLRALGFTKEVRANTSFTNAGAVPHDGDGPPDDEEYDDDDYGDDPEDGDDE
jgi:hypothetical protein